MIAVTSSSFLAIPLPLLIVLHPYYCRYVKTFPSNPHLNLVRNRKGLRVYSSKPGVQFVSIQFKSNPVIGAATQKAPNIFTSELCQTQLLVLHASSWLMCWWASTSPTRYLRISASMEACGPSRRTTPREDRGNVTASRISAS